MTATEKLRRMLDERGVKYFRHEDGEPLRELKEAGEPATSWFIGDVSVCAVPNKDGELFDLWIDHCTAEQAIVTTLGERTCHDAGFPPYIFECSECGANHLRNVAFIDMPRYCPRCGRVVVDE